MRLVAALLALTAFLAVGCGGDDDASPFDDSGSNESDDGDDEGDDDASGLGLDQETLEDLATGEIDPEDLDLEDLGLDDAIENAEDMIDQFGGDGGGTVQFDGDSIDFDAEICLVFEGDIDAEGAATAADGTPVWVSISHSVDTREELTEFIDESTLELLYGDADPIIQSSFSLEYGRADMFGDGADDQPDVSADSFDDRTTISVDLSGSSASGAGTGLDRNGVLGSFDDTFEFSFDVSCG